MNSWEKCLARLCSTFDSTAILDKRPITCITFCRCHGQSIWTVCPDECERRFLSLDGKSDDEVKKEGWRRGSDLRDWLGKHTAFLTSEWILGFRQSKETRVTKWGERSSREEGITLRQWCWLWWSSQGLGVRRWVNFFYGSRFLLRTLISWWMAIALEHRRRG